MTLLSLGITLGAYSFLTNEATVYIDGLIPAQMPFGSTGAGANERQ